MNPKKQTPVRAWHFLQADRRLRYSDRREVAGPVAPGVPGKWMRANGDPAPELCRAGMHASVDPLDALTYAPGLWVCRVEVRGDVVGLGGDKIAGRERRVIWWGDATPVVRKFARLCALDVFHLIPDGAWRSDGDRDLVLRFLRTGEGDAADAARAAYAAYAADAARAAYAAYAAYAAADAAYAADAAADAAREKQSRRLSRMLSCEVVRVWGDGR